MLQNNSTVVMMSRDRVRPPDGFSPIVHTRFGQWTKAASKSGIEFHFHFQQKNQAQTLQSAAQETQTSNLFEGWKKFQTHVKKPARLFECILW